MASRRVNDGHLGSRFPCPRRELCTVHAPRQVYVGEEDIDRSPGIHVL